MYQDSTTLMSNNQAVTATANSTNVIDLSVARDLGPGSDVKFSIFVTTTATAAGAATVVFALTAADDTALATNPTTLMQTPAIPKATLVAGVIILAAVVPDNYSYQIGQRYLGVIYTVATGPLTAGKFTAGLFVDLPRNVGYPEGINVTGF